MPQRTTSPVARRRTGVRSVLRRVCSVGAATLLAGTLAGCSALDSLTGGSSDAATNAAGTTRDGAGSEPTAAQAGDCIEVIPDGTFTELDIVTCDQNHTGEIFAATDLPEGRYPGEKKVVEQSNTFCKKEFSTFVGVPYDDSALYFVSFYPTKESWEQEDRAVQCVLESEKPIKKSLQGAQR